MFDYPLIDPGYLSDAKGLDMQVSDSNDQHAWGYKADTPR
jgi:hypothetical protein